MAPVILSLLLLFGSLPAIDPAQADSGSVTITATSLNVRQGPGLSYPVGGSVNKGEKYSILKQEGDWIQIRLGGSKKRMGGRMVHIIGQASSACSFQKCIWVTDRYCNG